MYSKKGIVKYIVAFHRLDQLLSDGLKCDLYGKIFLIYYIFKRQL